MNYPPPPPGGGPPPGGYGAPPPGGGYGAPPPQGGGYGPPPGQPGYGQGGYGAPPQGYGPPAGFGPPPPMPGMGGPMGGMGMMQPSAPFGVDPMTGMPFSDKSKMVAGLLNIGCVFIGFGGIGRFYTGHIGLGVAQLLLGWATCGVWPIVDGIMMLMGKVPDAEGRPLRD